MPKIEEIENPDRWSKWWFLAGGNIHRLWKAKNYTAIKDAASTLPKSAWDTQQSEINYLLSRIKVLEEVRIAAKILLEVEVSASKNSLLPWTRLIEALDNAQEKTCNE